MTTSRFITHPDIITKDKNTSIVLVDPTQNELSKVERFLQTSKQDFDVYIYYCKNNDLEYLNSICKDSKTFINQGSQVTATNSVRYQDDLIERFEQIEQSFG